jgi:hypothetical protein
VTYRRGDDVVIDLEELSAGGLPSKGTGQIDCDAGLLCDDEGFGHGGKIEKRKSEGGKD